MFGASSKPLQKLQVNYIICYNNTCHMGVTCASHVHHMCITYVSHAGVAHLKGYSTRVMTFSLLPYVLLETENITMQSYMYMIGGYSSGRANMEQVTHDMRQESCDMRQESCDMRQASRDIGQASRDIGQASCDIGLTSCDIGQNRVALHFKPLQVYNQQLWC